MTWAVSLGLCLGQHNVLESHQILISMFECWMCWTDRDTGLLFLLTLLYVFVLAICFLMFIAYTIWYNPRIFILIFSFNYDNLIIYWQFEWLDKLTPAAFEKHSGRETARKWKNNVWVIVNEEKVPLFKTVLLKYYNQASKNANGSHRSHNGRACHRDEFIRCTRCNKDRRFRLRTKEECRIHHDALADSNWKCSDLPYDKYVFPLHWMNASFSILEWIMLHSVCLICYAIGHSGICCDFDLFTLTL